MWTRELLFLEMWAGQMLCEGFNSVLKHIVQEDRPNRESSLIVPFLLYPQCTCIHPAEELGDGYGFPSSHSQWMGYFASFLVLHFSLRHRFVSTGYRLLDWARDVFLFAFIISWSASVAYSRCVQS